MTGSPTDVKAGTTLRVGDVITVRGRVEPVFAEASPRKERKARPVAIAFADEHGAIAVPFYTTGDGRPKRPWSGPRVGIVRDATNGLKATLSQIGTNNAFVVTTDVVGRRIGTLSDEDREIVRHLLLAEVASRT